MPISCISCISRISRMSCLSIAVMMPCLVAMTIVTGSASAASAIDIGLIPMKEFSCDPQAATPASGTPIPDAGSAGTPTAPQAVLPFGTPVLTEADYPMGDDADPAVAEALVALETRYTACMNAGNLPAAADLLAQPLRDRIFAPALLARKAQSTPVPSSDPVGAIALRCIRETSSGAAIAFVDAFDDNAVRGATMMRVYRETADGWRVIEQAGVKGVTAQSCPGE